MTFEEDMIENYRIEAANCTHVLMQAMIRIFGEAEKIEVCEPLQIDGHWRPIVKISETMFTCSTRGMPNGVRIVGRCLTCNNWAMTRLLKTKAEVGKRIECFTPGNSHSPCPGRAHSFNIEKRTLPGGYVQ